MDSPITNDNVEEGFSFIEDYVFFAEAQIRIYEVTGNPIFKENFKDNYTNKDDLYNLDKWEIYERSNPRIFAGMYQFLCKKI